MPTYTVKRDDPKAKKEWDVICSWNELQEMLLEYKLKQVLSVPLIVSGVGNLHSKTDDGWKENLKRIKKNAGSKSTIKL